MRVPLAPVWCCCCTVLAAAGDRSTAAAAPPVTFDGSLGPTASRSGTDMIIPASHGRIVGGNLFHSFGRFNVPNASRVTFQGPPRVNNVVARVTGGTASHIDGTVACDIPNANLFLLNPTGFVFGPGARVDVAGSFVVSTAHELKLADGGTFSALAPGTEVLTSAAPDAFGFVGGTRVSGVYVDRSTLDLAAGKPHALVAGEVRISGGRLLAPAGRISVVSVDGPGAVTGGTSPRPMADVPRGDVSLTDDAQLSAAADTGGSIAVAAHHLDVDRSLVSARTSTGDALGGVEIDLSGDLTLRGGLIRTGTDGPGRAGPVHVAADTIELVGEGALPPQGIETASGLRLDVRNANIRGRAGDIRVQATTLRILDGAAIDGSTYTLGDGGDIDVTVRGDAFFSNVAGILKPPPDNMVDQLDEVRDTGIIARTYGNFAGSGSSGDVDLTAANLTLRSSGIVTSTTRGLGNAGDVRVTVPGHIHISSPADVPGRKSSGGILAQTLPQTFGTVDAGDGGNAIVRAGSITLSSPDDAAGAVIGAASRGNGRAGSVLVEAGDVLIQGPGGLIHALSLAPNQSTEITGSAGGVTLRVGSLRVLDGGGVSVGTATRGAAGQLQIDADKVEVADDGRITTESTGTGATGTMRLHVRDELVVRSGNMSGRATVANGGNVVLVAPRVILSDAALAANANNGSGGNLTILSFPLRDDGTFTALGQTSLVANSQLGQGGNIKIVAPNQAIDPTVIIDASGVAETDAGTIDINTTQTDLAGSLVPLRSDLQSPFARLYDLCAAQTGRDISSFVQVGRGGVPQEPAGPVSMPDLPKKPR